jgi:hypothetical protein
MGALCLQAAVLGLFLPETKGKPTMETMDDMKKRQESASFINGESKPSLNENEIEL